MTDEIEFAPHLPTLDLGSWTPINLADLPERKQVSSSIGASRLAYPGKRHAFSGPPESAKTLAAYATALEEIHNERTVVLLDFEMGPYDARDRLRDLGASDEELACLHYFEPAIPPTPARSRRCSR